MSKLILAAGLCLMVVNLASSSNLMCYYTNWSASRRENAKYTVSDIDPNLCSHLIYAFASLSYSYEIIPASPSETQSYQTFNGLKARNPELKTLLAIGGWAIGTARFSAMVSTYSRRQAFIQSSIKILRENNFDGINLDWEFPGTYYASDKQRFTSLCKELYEAYEAESIATGRARLLVTSAVASGKRYIDGGYEIAKIAKYLDFIIVMTHELHGTWDGVAGHHSPLYKRSSDVASREHLNADYVMRYWRDQGTPAEKLLMAFAAYGRTFTLASSSTFIGAPIIGTGSAGLYTSERGFWSYYEVCHYLRGTTINWIADQQVPYGVTGRVWVGFDNKDSAESKVAYIKENNFGGISVWSLDLDDFSGTFCNDGKYPLISHLNKLLISDQGDTSAKPTQPPMAQPQSSTKNSRTTRNSGIQPAPTTAKTQTIAKTTRATKKATTRSAGQSDAEFCKGKANGLYTNPSDPTTYFNCHNGNTYQQNCPPGLVFYDNCKCCGWP